jgi:hypothetical protein
VFAIDNDWAFPHEFGSMQDINAIWMQDERSQQPLSAELADLIQSLDVKETVDELTKIGLSAGQISIFKVMTLFVKTAVAAKLSLFEMGCMIIDNEGTTELEGIIKLARQTKRSLEKTFKQHFAEKASQIEQNRVSDTAARYAAYTRTKTFKTFESYLAHTS